MSRPTRLVIEPTALLHNLARIRQFAPGKKIITMVKANAYGCGLHTVVPILEGKVDAFGVACIEEAMVIRKMGSRTYCILFQGVFSPEEFKLVALYQLGCVLHQRHQIQWLLSTPLDTPIKLWIKVDTGMHRLGFKPDELQEVMNALQNCPWIDKDIGLMTHLACADEPERIENFQQISIFDKISVTGFSQRSIANSAAIISFPQTHADVIRPGIMLYGVSPFANQTAIDLGLLPVMRFVSAISAVHDNPPGVQVGYSGTWSSNKPSRIGIVAVGYGDGYPRHIAKNTPVWIQDREVMIVGRVSMDMLAVDLTDHTDIKQGASVELWGPHILVERIAHAAGTSGYELLCQISERVRHN
ncbi:alanine racemase [Legionella sp.]|uniref:alanine racemase n=1 Tax=Legionella sp. TaxID=459 RepID=UPI003C850929